MNKYKIFFAAMALFFLFSCTEKQDKNTLLVATSADNPPYEYMQNGRVSGFDIDLMNKIGESLGKKIEFRNIDFPGLLAALSSNNVDLVIAGVSITPERLAKVDFSVPYAEARVAILYRVEDDFAGLEDLQGKIVGSQLGTTWALIANDISIKYGFKTQTLSSNLMLVEDLKNKRLDAVVLDEFQVQKFIEKNAGLAKFSASEYNSEFAIVFPKESVLKNDVDEAIIMLKNNGTIDSLLQKWGIVSVE